MLFVGKGGSLRRRLIALSLAALTPGFLVIALTEVQVSRSRQDEVNELALRSATQAAFEMDRIVSGIQSLLVAVSEVPAIRALRADECTTYLASLRPRLANVTAISLLDATGQYRCGSLSGAASEITFGDRAYFREALSQVGAVTGDYTSGRVTGRPVLPIALAVIDPSGQTSGVLVASLDLGWLNEELRQRGLPPDGSVTVADRRGVIIARQPMPDRFVGTRIPEAFMRLVNGKAAGIETVVSQDGTLRVLGYVPVSLPPMGLYVSVGLSAEASYGAVRRAAAWGALIAICAGLATLAASWWVGSRVFVQPITRVIEVVRAWRRGDRTARTGFQQEAGEIAVLGATLDLMMDEIEASEDQRELLASELSHRIKNTLATVQAIAASTLNKPAPAATLLPEFIGRIAALARTHEVLTRDRWEGADLRDIAVRVVRPLCGDADDRLSIDGPPVDCPARQALGLTMVLHELCTNALKYGALSVPRGRVELSWSTLALPLGTAVTLVWRERNGPPVVRPKGKTGFGSRLMARALGEDGTTALDFDASGVTCRVDLVIGLPEPQGRYLEHTT